MVGRVFLVFLIIVCQILATDSAFLNNSLINLPFDIFNFCSFQTLVNRECCSQLKLLNQSFYSGEEWALRMIDATAKPQAGILFGNIMHIGNYDECLEIGKIYGDGQVKGKYCTVLFEPYENYENQMTQIIEFGGGITIKEENSFTTTAKRSFGFCLPSACKAKDLQLLTNYFEKTSNFPLHFKFVDDFCDDGGGQPLSAAAISAISIFSVFGVIIVCSTAYDALYYQHLDEKIPTLFIAFSFLTNGKKLLATSTAEGTLNCLNGLRVISMMWIVLGHRFMVQFFTPQINAAHIVEWRKKIQNSFLVSMNMGVDTFFTISGLLVVYLYMKSREKGIKFSLSMFYLHRILRLTPSLVMVTLLSGTLLKYMGRGPFWPAVYEEFQQPCEKNWWSTVTYLQNYVHTEDQCVGQAWYLGVDTQMYFISPLIFFPLVRWPKRTTWVIFIFVVLNCGYVFTISYIKHLGVGFLDQSSEQYTYIYSPTHVRGTVYLLGMVCGYFVFKTRNNPPKLCQMVVYSMWAVSLLVMLAIILSHAYFTKYENGYSPLEAAFFNSLCRVTWSLALCVIILLCVNGYGGLIDAFLSSKVFVVLIRINYNVYLLHLLIIMFLVAQNQTSTYSLNTFGYHLFWGDYAFSVGAATLWSLAFESPVLAIEKIIFGNKKNKNDLVLPK